MTTQKLWGRKEDRGKRVRKPHMRADNGAGSERSSKDRETKGDNR